MGQALKHFFGSEEHGSGQTPKEGLGRTSSVGTAATMLVLGKEAFVDKEMVVEIEMDAVLG